MLSVFSPSKGRPFRSAELTARALPQAQFVVPEGEAQAYRFALPNNMVHPHGGSKIDALNWVIDHCMNPGEWAIFADDDISHFTAPPEPYWSKENTQLHRDPQSLYDEPVSPERLESIIAEALAMAEQNGANLIGFGTNANWFMRKKKWSLCSMVIGEFFLLRKTGLRFPQGGIIEDLAMTAEHLLRDGCVVVCRYLRAHAQHWQSGGYGSRRDRRDARMRSINRLHACYPGLFRDHNSDPAVPNVRLRYSSTSGLAKWRKEMLT